MRTMDLSPLYRASVGFDRLFKTLDAASRVDESAFSYPPYNIEKVSEDSYRIVMAVAGFGEGDLDITAKENSLVISGKKEKAEDETATLDEEHKVTVCHIPPGNPANRHEISVDADSLESHLAHGDIEGECPDAEQGDVPSKQEQAAEQKAARDEAFCERKGNDHPRCRED